MDVLSFGNQFFFENSCFNDFGKLLDDDDKIFWIVHGQDLFYAYFKVLIDQMRSLSALW